MYVYIYIYLHIYIDVLYVICIIMFVVHTIFLAKYTKRGYMGVYRNEIVWLVVSCAKPGIASHFRAG